MVVTNLKLLRRHTLGETEKNLVKPVTDRDTNLVPSEYKFKQVHQQLTRFVIQLK
jgi:hypothetical protein